MVFPSRCFSSLLIGLALALAALPAAAEPSFPQLTGRVVDEAGLLSAAEKAQLKAVEAWRRQGRR